MKGRLETRAWIGGMISTQHSHKLSSHFRLIRKKGENTSVCTALSPWGAYSPTWDVDFKITTMGGGGLYRTSAVHPGNIHFSRCSRICGKPIRHNLLLPPWTRLCSTSSYTWSWLMHQKTTTMEYPTSWPLIRANWALNQMRSTSVMMELTQ